MNKLKKNRGFSIAETAIALAIIAIVTAAALTVVMASISARVKATNISEAQDFAHNMLECFKAADNNIEFEDNVRFVFKSEGEESEDVDLEEIGFSKIDGTAYKYTAENKFKAEITANCDDGEFSITVVDAKGEEIISLDYTKGAK